MTRKNGRRNNKGRKNRGRSRKQALEPQGFGATVYGNDGTPVNLQIVSYSITDEPLHLDNEQIFSAENEDMYARAYELMQDGNVHDAMPIYKELLDRYPRVGRLYNNLACCYRQIGENEKATELIKLNYATNPKYLFGRLDYAQSCMIEGKHDEIPKIFDGLYDLKMLYPDRDVFHIQEVVAFNGIMSLYFAKIGKTETALVFYNVLKELAPKHQTTSQLRMVLMPAMLLKGLRGERFTKPNPKRVLKENEEQLRGLT